jgi:hypothetical protein
VTDERLIIGVAFPDRREGNGPGGVETTETRLLSVNRDGNEIKTDLIPPAFFRTHPGLWQTGWRQFQDRVISILPGSPHVLISLSAWGLYPAVYRLNVMTGEMSSVEESRPPIMTWIADRQGVVRAGAGQEDSSYVVIVKDPSTGRWREFARYDLDQSIGLVPVGFGNDPAELFVGDQDRGRRAIFD